MAKTQNANPPQPVAASADPRIAHAAHFHSGHCVLEPAGAGWRIRVVGGPNSGKVLGEFGSVDAGKAFVKLHGIRNCRLVAEVTL